LPASWILRGEGIDIKEQINLVVRFLNTVATTSRLVTRLITTQRLTPEKTPFDVELPSPASDSLESGLR